MALHPERERLRAAQNQPRVERTGHATRGVLNERDALVQISVVARERSAYDVRVSAEVFRRRVKDEIRSELQRLLKIWAGERVVGEGERPAAVGDLDDRRDVEHLEQGIRRRLDP